MKKNTVLVTGGLGFIGSNLIEFLINKKIRVINVDKVSYSSNFYNVKDFIKSKYYKFYKIDIVEKNKFLKILNKEKPSTVFNLAAETHVDRSIDSPHEFFTNNIIGVYNILEAIRKYNVSNKNIKLIHISTDEVYGDVKKGRSDENYKYHPSSPYAASKASSDHLVSSYYKTYKLPVIITNCSNNYGPYQFPEKLIPHILLNAINGDPLPVYGDGSQIRDWLYVDDHVSALYLALNKAKPGSFYNIGGHNEISNLEVVQIMCDVLEENREDNIRHNIRLKDLIEFVDDRPGHDIRYAIDASKIFKELSWKPKEDFYSGIQKTVKWYLKNKLWWKNILNKNYELKRLGVK